MAYKLNDKGASQILTSLLSFYWFQSSECNKLLGVVCDRSSTFSWLSTFQRKRLNSKYTASGADPLKCNFTGNWREKEVVTKSWIRKKYEGANEKHSWRKMFKGGNTKCWRLNWKCEEVVCFFWILPPILAEALLRNMIWNLKVENLWISLMLQCFGK